MTPTELGRSLAAAYHASPDGLDPSDFFDDATRGWAWPSEDRRTAWSAFSVRRLTMADERRGPAGNDLEPRAGEIVC